VPVLQDRDSSDGTATKQFLITGILFDRQITALYGNIFTPFSQNLVSFRMCVNLLAHVNLTALVIIIIIIMWDRFVNKLVNSAILLICKIRKFGNVHFVGNLFLNMGASQNEFYVVNFLPTKTINSKLFIMG